jgi:hypothetical protein
MEAMYLPAKAYRKGTDPELSPTSLSYVLFCVIPYYFTVASFFSL